MIIQYGILNRFWVAFNYQLEAWAETKASLVLYFFFSRRVSMMIYSFIYARVSFHCVMSKLIFATAIKAVENDDSSSVATL